MIDKLPIKGGSQGQYLGGILLFFIVFISGMKTLPPIISGRIGYRPFDKNAPQITIEKGVVFHVEAKGAGRAGVAAERQGRVLAGGILRVGTIQADDSGANAQP
ncbi:Uncharacterised protein [Klebsiella pneumoniae]|nr:Uncharacterised protein [Klebsiella pneumoniae]